jgi:hypothetical protein
VLAVEVTENNAWCGTPSSVCGRVVQKGEPWALDVEVVGNRFRSPEVMARGTFRCAGETTPFSLNQMGVFGEVLVDPDWHTFRLFTPETVPACLRATTEDRDKIVVHADGVEAYAASAKRAVGDKGGTVKAASEAGPDDLKGRSALLLGAPWENPVVETVLGAWDGPVEIARDAVTVGGERHEGKALSLLLSFRNPASPDRFVTIYLDLDRSALRRPPRFTFYGWDGWVLFDGGRAVARGSTEELRAPAVTDEPVDPAPPHRYEVPKGQAESILKALVDPGLEGRGEGQRGARLAESIVALEMYRAGLEVRRAPFSFEVLDFRGGDLMIGNEVVEGAFVAHPSSAETAGLVTRLRRDLDLVPWPAADDRRAWRAYTYPSRQPATGGGHPGKGGHPGGGKGPSNPWRRASGAQASLELGGKTVKLAVKPRVLEALRPDDPLIFSVRFERRTFRSANVIGVLEGTDPSAPVVLVGAHYDGLGREGDEVFASADDNASGVAAMLTAARMLASGPRLRHTLVFAAFGAEEWGMRGSRAFVAGKTLGDRPIAAMVNLDTVGKKDVADVYVIGRSKHPALANAAMRALKESGFGTGKDIDRFAFREGSDHWPFHAAGIPAIDLWSSDYRIMNTAADTPEKVDPAKLERLARAVVDLLLTVPGVTK